MQRNLAASGGTPHHWRLVLTARPRRPFALSPQFLIPEGHSMPHHPHPPTPTTMRPAPGSAPVPPGAYGPARSAPLAAGPREEVTTVLPRRPFAYAGPPGAPPAPPGMPVWGPSPGYRPSFAPERPRRRPTWARIAIGAAVVVAMVGAGLMINAAASPDDSSTLMPAPATSAAPVDPGPAPQAPTVPLSALPGLMLDVATINSIEGTTDIGPPPGDNGKDDYAYSGVSTDRPERSEVHTPALDSELDNSGWIGVRTQSLQDRDGARHRNHSAAIYFATAKAANDFAAKQAQAWPKCSGATLHLTERGHPSSIWTAGTVTNHDGMLSITNTQEGGGGWQCQRALAARNNIVIDVRSCGENRTDQAITIATRMAERVTTR